MNNTQLPEITKEEFIYGSALIMQALLLAIKEIRSITMLIPLSTMSETQLRQHFINAAGQKVRAMSDEQFAEFCLAHFKSDDFK